MAAELEARLRAMAVGDVEAAISGGDVEAVRRWLETGGDVNAKGDGPGATAQETGLCFIKRVLFPSERASLGSRTPGLISKQSKKITKLA